MFFQTKISPLLVFFVSNSKTRARASASEADWRIPSSPIAGPPLREVLGIWSEPSLFMCIFGRDEKEDEDDDEEKEKEKEEEEGSLEKI